MDLVLAEQQIHTPTMPVVSERTLEVTHHSLTLGVHQIHTHRLHPHGVSQVGHPTHMQREEKHLDGMQVLGHQTLTLRRVARLRDGVRARGRPTLMQVVEVLRAAGEVRLQEGTLHRLEEVQRGVVLHLAGLRILAGQRTMGGHHLGIMDGMLRRRPG